MSGYGKLSKATSKLYLAMFIVSFICMLINTVFICIDVSGVKIGESIQHKITSEITEVENSGNEYVLPEIGLDMSMAISDKVFLGDGLFITLAGIILLLFLRNICFVDVRTREFEHTLPVKKTTLVMHEYCFFFLLITGLTIIQGIILLIYQTHYNNVWVKTAGQSASDMFNSAPIQRIVFYTGMYILTLLLIFTWVYLTMTVSKNALSGVIVGVVSCIGLDYIDSYFGLADIVMNVFSKCPAEYEQDSYGRYHVLNADTLFAWEQKKSYLQNVIDAIIHPVFRFDYLEGVLENNTSLFSDNIVYGNTNFDLKTIPFSLLLAIIIVTLVVLILFIWLAGKKRDFTKGGRLSYFKFVEWLFAIFIGFLIFAVLLYVFFYNSYDGYNDNWIIALLPAVAVTIVIIYILTPVKFRLKLSDGFATKRSILSRIYNLNRVIITSIVGLLIASYNIKVMINDIYTTYHEDDGIISDFLRDCFYSTFKSSLYNFVITTVFVTVALLISSKCFGYWSEKNRSVMEFYYTLPESRITKKIKSILYDLLIVIIPFAVSLIYLVYIYLPNTDIRTAGYNYALCVGIVRNSLIVGMFYVFMMVGLLHFIEEMFTNGIMRPIAYIGVIIMVVFSMDGAVNTFKKTFIDDDICNLLRMNYLDGESTKYIVFYSLTGVLLFVLSIILSKKKELSRNEFYFNFSKYLFAFLIAGTLFMITQPYVVAMWHRVVILLSCIIVFLILAYYMTPKEQRVVYKSS